MAIVSFEDGYGLYEVYRGWKRIGSNKISGANSHPASLETFKVY
jgi:hypothetical protein